ncbi:MAG: hypothetical protein KIT11_05125 [Fimbriimonadaceae bacterium]|nr:hypothetical protein [Fimbriimonadaceae bacterium]QYK56725.1 MAG: hypothetical protein KF733_04395 [Fimbriimonadaceae bacterium]
MSDMTPSNPASFDLRRSPATWGLIISLAVGFVLGWIPSVGQQWGSAVIFDGSLSRPWTLLTYPFGGLGGALSYIFAGLWLHGVGRYIEEREGSGRLLFFFFGLALVASLGIALAALSGIRPALLGDPWIPIAGLTCIWAAREPDQPIRFMFVLQLAAKWVALVAAVLIFFGYGAGAPLIGVLAVLPCVVGWFYGRGNLRLPARDRMVSTGRGPAQSPKEFDAYINKVKDRERERDERERLRRLLESSVSEEGPEDR